MPSELSAIVANTLLLFSLDIVGLISNYLIYPSAKFAQTARTLQTISNNSGVLGHIRFLESNSRGEIWIGTSFAINILNHDHEWVRLITPDHGWSFHALTFSKSHAFCVQQYHYKSMQEIVRLTFSDNPKKEVVYHLDGVSTIRSILVSKDEQTAHVLNSDHCIMIIDLPNKNITQAHNYPLSDPTDIRMNREETELFVLSNRFSNITAIYNVYTRWLLRTIDDVYGDKFTFDHNSNILVTRLRGVHVYQPDGKLLAVVGVEHSSHKMPTAVCVDMYGRIYVGDDSGYVTVYAFS